MPHSPKTGTNNYFNLSLLGLNGIFLIYLPLALKKIKENKNYIILFLLFGFVFLINSLGEGFRFYNNTSFVLCFLSSLLISKTIDLYSNISRVDFKWIYKTCQVPHFNKYGI